MVDCHTYYYIKEKEEKGGEGEGEGGEGRDRDIDQRWGEENKNIKQNDNRRLNYSFRITSTLLQLSSSHQLRHSTRLHLTRSSLYRKRGIPYIDVWWSFPLARFSAASSSTLFLSHNLRYAGSHHTRMRELGVKGPTNPSPSVPPI